MADRQSSVIPENLYIRITVCALLSVMNPCIGLDTECKQDHGKEVCFRSTNRGRGGEGRGGEGRGGEERGGKTKLPGKVERK